jgi:glycosyltransferase involved in cell wall biosynthesis
MKSRTIKTTIYIPSHNYGRYLGEAIESVLRQTTDQWELMVIDDNSQDSTLDVMNLYKGDERIRLFKTSGIGLPAIGNLAMREGKGKYIMRLDADDILDENAVLVMVNYLEKHPEIAIVFPDYYLFDEFGEIYAAERREKLAEKNHVFDVPANGACTLIRRKVLREIGGYREDLTAQDGFDIWSRMTNIYKFANINLPLFYYRRHQQNLTNNTTRILAARQKIKMETIQDQIDNFRPIIAVIPCRRNFDFCLDLWKQDIQDKSLLQRQIEICLSSPIYDHVVVASDNPAVKNVMSLFTDPRLKVMKRKKEETIRSRSIVPTLENVCRDLDPDFKGITSLIYLQSAFVKIKTIEEAIASLIMNQADCAIGVVEIGDPLYRRMAHGLEMINRPKGPSSDFDTIYRESNTSLATRNKNFKRGSLTGPCIVNYFVSSDESFVINSKKMLKIARILAEEESE